MSFLLLQWQFGYNSCFIRNHLLVYLRLILGYAEIKIASVFLFSLYLDFKKNSYIQPLSFLVFNLVDLPDSFFAATAPCHFTHSLHR